MNEKTSNFTRESDKLAIISLAAGILSLITLKSCGWILAFISVVLATKALNDSCCTKRPAAITGIITSFIGVIVAIIIALIGMRPMNMPDLTGKNYSDAKLELNELSYELTIETIEEYNDIVEKNVVVRTDPMVGEALNKNDTVIMYVSKGRELLMPNIIGLKFEDAKALLAEMEMELYIKDEEYNENEKGTIIQSQYAEGYEFKHTGTNISVVVSKGTLEDEITELTTTAETVTHDDLLRYPDSCLTKPIKLTLNVTKVEDQTFLGFAYGTTIWATLDGKTVILSDDREITEPAILEGDTITVYGYGKGLTTLNQTEEEYWGSLLLGFTYDKTVDTVEVPYFSIRTVEFE